MIHNRVDGDFFLLTQDVISMMLGVQRTGVTEAAGSLQKKGIITYSRGRITILDRQKLEETSCECYWIVREEYDRLTGTQTFTQ
jgi:DNA-binding FadR family transcriptional regulator